jgi:hypothetical protein
VQTLDWKGNLPPATLAARSAPPPQIEIAAAGQSAPEDALRRSWRFNVAISVVLGE